jgi:hypothetical protein
LVPHEVHVDIVVKITENLLAVREIKPIVEFYKFKDHFYSLGLVVTTQATVVGAPKNALDALVGQVWANRVFLFIQRIVKGFHLGE